MDRQTSSPLNPSAPIRLCTFSPCIEQVEQTVTALRRLGWTEIDMVEIQHKRIDVRRERIGLQEEGLRGVNAAPATVEESLGRLRQLEDSQAEFHRKQSTTQDIPDNKHKKKGNAEGTLSSKQARAEINQRELGQRKTWKEGMLCHRSEPELKTHTSYLVFAILPQAWSGEDEKIKT
jgi:tRNA (adenine57-N1/adenine58-N1)-methyltransferase catalytic subunit